MRVYVIQNGTVKKENIMLKENSIQKFRMQGTKTQHNYQHGLHGANEELEV